MRVLAALGGNALLRRARSGTVLGAGLALLATGCAAGLPEDLYSPDPRVVCNAARGACYDRLGASIGLTQSFLGREAAERLTAELREAPRTTGPQAAFSPAPGVECVRETGPCRVQGATHEALTAVLFGPWTGAGLDAEIRALRGIDWQWLGSRYADGTSVRPVEPARYTLRLEADGTAHARADCNRAGGGYRLEGRRITIGIVHSTRAACGPDSLEAVFLRDLARSGYFRLQDGRLFLELSYGSGTMEFAR